MFVFELSGQTLASEGRNVWEPLRSSCSGPKQETRGALPAVPRRLTIRTLETTSCLPALLLLSGASQSAWNTCAELQRGNLSFHPGSSVRGCRGLWVIGQQRQTVHLRSRCTCVAQSCLTSIYERITPPLK